MGILGLGLVGLGSVIAFHPNTPADAVAGYVMLLIGVAILAIKQFGGARQ